MRLAQLLLPVPSAIGRDRCCRDLRKRYDRSAPLFCGEGSVTALGVVASVGFLALLAFAVAGNEIKTTRGVALTSRAKICCARWRSST